MAAAKSVVHFRYWNCPTTKRGRGWPVANKVGIRRPALLVGLGFGAIAITVSLASMAGGASNNSLKMYEQSGMDKFKKGNIAGALADFDTIIQTYPTAKPYLWQRGICLYYLNKFEEGAAQFRQDVQVNPNDSEEAIWCFLCEAQIYGVPEARARMIPINNRVSFMRKLYNLFKLGGDPQELLSHIGDTGGQEGFYTTFYSGLYYESQKDDVLAKSTILAAIQSPYGLKATDYMAWVARIHCKVRGWE